MFASCRGFCNHGIFVALSGYAVKPQTQTVSRPNNPRRGRSVPGCDLAAPLQENQ